MKKLFLLSLLFFLSNLLFSQTTSSINKIYLRENVKRPNVVPTISGYQYETIFDFTKNWKRPKASDLVLVKIKSFNIDGQSVNEKEVTLDLKKLKKTANSLKLQKGIRMMNIGDKYRFFISMKIDYDRELHVHIACPLIKVYEVELKDILKKDGSSKFPKQTARYVAVTQTDNFDTQSIYNLAKQKAYVKSERAEIKYQQMKRAQEMYGDTH